MNKITKIFIGISILFLITLYYHQNADNSPIIRNERNVAKEYNFESLIEDMQNDSVDVSPEKVPNVDTIEVEIKHEIMI